VFEVKVALIATGRRAERESRAEGRAILQQAQQLSDRFVLQQFGVDA
jgi:hypothetical protein